MANNHSLASLCTLCYLERDGKYLMLHRNVKQGDVNRDKWVGVGGHFEANESPEECLLREVKEETGYTLTSWQFRGLVTFISGKGVTEYMCLFTADGFEGEMLPCDEGDLAWVNKDEICRLNIWEGDRVFFQLLNAGHSFFSLKMMYDSEDNMTKVELNGVPIEFSPQEGAVIPAI